MVHLALHPQGVTIEQARRDLWPDGAEDPAHEAIEDVRAWAGSDKRTKPATPFVSFTPAEGRHRLRGHLLDWDLLQRLRLRGHTRAAAGKPGAIADYRSALQLVRGPVLHPRPDDRYRWATGDGDRMDQHILRSVVATAHELVDLALAGDDPAAAQRAADVACRADPGHAFDRPLTDLMRIAHARSNHGRVRRLAALLLDLRGVEVVEELAPSTFRVVDSLLPDGVTRAETSTGDGATSPPP